MVRHRIGLTSLFPLALLGALAACEPRDATQGRSPASSPAVEPAPVTITSAPAHVSLPVEPRLDCSTMRDVAVSDVVRVDGTTLFYADGSDGLGIVDVTDSLRPRSLATVPFVGTPTALFVREGIAWLVFVDPDSRFIPGKTATVVRAIDVRSPAEPRVIGQLVREGTAHDAKLVGGVLYTMRETGGRTAIESFGFRKDALTSLAVLHLGGVPSQLAASSSGLSVVTDIGEGQSSVSWLDLPLDQPGTISVRETVRMPGAVATWVRGEGRIVSADDGQRVRFVTCATRSCAPGEAATLRVVDFGAGATARVGPSLRLTEHGGLPLARFVDELLFVAETSPSSRGSSTLHIVATEDAGARFVGHMPLRGLLSALVPHDSSSIVALGTIETLESASSIIVHDIDVRKPSAPRLRSTVSFGSDWTWSVALDQDEAVSFDPGSHLMAIPFTAWRAADRRYMAGTQLVDLTHYGAQTAATLPAEGYIERAIFLDGHLVSIGPRGVVGIDYVSARRDYDLTEHEELRSRPSTEKR